MIKSIKAKRGLAKWTRLGQDWPGRGLPSTDIEFSENYFFFFQIEKRSPFNFYSTSTLNSISILQMFRLWNLISISAFDFFWPKCSTSCEGFIFSTLTSDPESSLLFFYSFKLWLTTCTPFTFYTRNQFASKNAMTSKL